MKRNTTPVTAFGLLLLLSACSHEPKNDPKTLNTERIPVRTITLGSALNKADIAATGLVTTEDEAAYSFKIGGVIENIYVDEGQFFKKGELLATLNNTEIGAGLDQANLNVEKARRDYTRTVNLYKDSVYSLEQMQDAKTRLDLSLKARQGVAFNARYSSIYAASDGFVNKKIANTGEVIAAGAPVLAINATNGSGNYILKVGVTDKEWVFIKTGQRAKVVLDGFPGDTIAAAVSKKSQVAQNGDGSFQIELRLELKTTKPAIGMFGKAYITTLNSTTDTVIPYDALVEADGDRAFVFTLTAQGKIKRIPITISRFNNDQVYVKSGLGGINQVIVSNSAFLNENSHVKVIK